MIYAIGDLHFDSSGEKPMDVFGHIWLNHQEKLIENWCSIIDEDDIVLLVGDISWALKIDDAYEDLTKIDSLPGRKIIIKGNHDYWWGSLKKLNSLGLKTIDFIQNNSFIYKNIGIAGTRGWSYIDEDLRDPHNEKIFNRELNRLRLSLESLDKTIEKKIVMLHYPPFNIDSSPNDFVKIMKEFKVDICIYGHLHAEGHKYIVEGIVDDIEFHCVSSDYLNFIPKKIL